MIRTAITRFAVAAPLIIIAVLAATHNLLSPSPIVIGAQVAALLVAVWARRAFPRGTFRVTASPAATDIIRRGPYRTIRHPMYAAALLFVWAAVLSHWNVVAVTLGVLLTAIVTTRIVLEERLLQARYPGYAAYAGTTKTVIPYIL